MARWTAEFRDRLRDFDRPYAPMFRLQVGGASLRGLHRGKWEELHELTLEILTHPGTQTYWSSGANPVYGEATGAMGEPVLYGVGLTGRISLGAQSVQTRSWLYTGPTLSVGVSQWAASMATRIPTGTLARLQIKFAEMDDPD